MEKMKEVLISIKQEWCRRIGMGDKIIEVRKSEPKEIPFKAYIYETKGSFKKSKELKGPCLLVPFGAKIASRVENGEPRYTITYTFKGRGKVIGEFICDSIEMFTMDYRQSDLGRRIEILKEACLSFEEATDYQAGAHVLYAWHISDLKIYAEPKELSEFNIARPPQSWRYIKEESK